ncbi:glutaredoxin 3 [Rheinheimera sp.]|uniref:glutaredoxin 3 n=1 Tax=Rheinheimera sp. TaxID=1869214 RepID=UPI00307DB5FF
MAHVTIYTKDYCPYCVRAKSLLSSKAVQFEEIQIDRQPERRPEMIERAKGRTTVPQIFIGDRHVGGCDDLVALDAAGGLDALLSA